MRELPVDRAHCHRPSLIFLDEPRPVSTRWPPRSPADLQSLVANGEATVFLTNPHNLAEARKACTARGGHSRREVVAIGHPMS